MAASMRSGRSTTQSSAGGGGPRNTTTEDEEERKKKVNIAEPTPWIKRKVEYFGPFRLNIKQFLKLATPDARATEDGIWGYTLVLRTPSTSKDQPAHETVLRIYE